jgi:hypothetical protein
MDQTSSRICPWCSGEVPNDSPACPKCGALVEGARVADFTTVLPPVVDSQASVTDVERSTVEEQAVEEQSGTEGGPVETATRVASVRESTVEPEAAATDVAESEAAEPANDVAGPEPAEEPAPDPEPADAAFSADAVQPPTEEVRVEMRKLELEAEIENAGRNLIGPAGQTIAIGAPSHEAMDALHAGLLDKEGPAGEPDLAADAQPWEDPELEARIAAWLEENPDRS